MIQVKTFYAYNELRNFSYLLIDDETGYSWVIDPFDSQPIIDYIKKEGLHPKGILNTHTHWDHIRGNAPLIEAFQIPLDFPCMQLDTIETPGHTLDHKAFLLNSKFLFSGDSLFNAGVGNCKGGGDVGKLYDSTEKLKLLSDDVIILPGHDYIMKNLEFALMVDPQNVAVKEELLRIKDESVEKRRPATLGQEKLVNPFLKSDRSTFYKLRSMRDNF